MLELIIIFKILRTYFKIPKSYYDFILKNELYRTRK